MARVTRACSQAQHSLVERCFAGASKEVKEAALAAVQQLPVREVAELESRRAGAAGLLNCAVEHMEDRALCKLLVEHNTELAGAELVYAAHYGKEERVRQLLAEGIPVDARDEHGRTPLLAVAASPVDTIVDLQLRLARMLLEAGAAVDATLPSNATALWASIEHRRFALADLLLDAGASPTTTPSQETLLFALVAVASQSSFQSPSGAEDYYLGGLACRLVAAGVAVDAASPFLSLTPLTLAAANAVGGGLQCEQMLGLVEALLDLGADPRAQEDEGHGLMVHMAAVLAAEDHSTPLDVPKFRAVLQRLVAAGAEINDRGLSGLSVLGVVCIACTNPALGPPEPLLRALVDAGADLLAEQPIPLPHLLLSPPPRPNAASTLRAIAALGYPMEVEFGDKTALQELLAQIYGAVGRWPNQQPPSPLQLSCLEALVDAGCPLAARPTDSSEGGGMLDDFYSDPVRWLTLGIGTGSLAVVQALLRACPAVAMSKFQALGDATALENTTSELCMELMTLKIEQFKQSPLEGVLGERVVWYCAVASLLLTAGSPPAAPGSWQHLYDLPGSWPEQLRFIPLVAQGSSWSPERHHLYPPDFCAAARQLLLVHECCGFGASQPSSGQTCGAGHKRRAGSRRSRKPARAIGIQLPRDVLHHILELASQPILHWMPQLGAYH